MPTDRQIVTKVIWRLLPYLMVLYWFNYLDRVNISVAKLQMNIDLNFDDDIFGYGAAIFYIGYFFFEVPSNIMLEKLGARVWIARIMITWGLVSAGFYFTHSKWSFYALRFMLGVTEAGFFPGVLLYLTYWIPSKRRAKVGALFMTAIAMACAAGMPLSSWVMDSMSGVQGLKGWQWLFLLEGAVTVLLGCSVYFFLTDKPVHARWLPKAERDWLVNEIEAERAHTHSGHGRHELMHALVSPRVWGLSMIYMALMCGFYGIIYWTPTITKEVYKAEFGDPSDVRVGVLSAIPYVSATIGMLLLGWLCDKTEKRRGMVIFGMILGSLSMLAASQTHSTVLTLMALSGAAIGILGALSPFWTLPPAFLTGTAAAAGIAFINSWGNLGGGYGATWLMGYLKKRYNTYTYGLMFDAGMLLLGAAMTLCLKMHAKPAALEVPSVTNA